MWSLVAAAELDGQAELTTMRLAEKTLELTLCHQIGAILMPWRWAPFPHGGPQPIWFGLTQKQEAEAGFDAATKLAGGRLLLLQSKAGHRLKSGMIRFTAPHDQLEALQKRVRSHRLVYYVLPGVTATRDLAAAPWLLARTWFLDVAGIPTLSKPGRKSNYHNVTLNPHTGSVVITSDPVNAKAVDWEYIAANSNPQALGAKFETFESFWKYAQLLGPRSVGVCLPAA